MNIKKTIIPFAVALICLSACGDKKAADHGHPHPHPGETAEPAGHGSATDLGTVTVAGKQFGVVRLGEVVPGKEGAFEVRPKGVSAAEVASLNLYLWIESEDGTQLSAPAKGSPENGALHFHVTTRKGGKMPVRVVLRLRADGTDERSGLPLDGHGHEHGNAPHHGEPATFKGGEQAGHLELKLHDDKGDLELWLAEDAKFTRPFDLPLDASVEVEFIDVKGRKVILRPRNTSKNEDEDGNPNIRDGKTNYFIFPSQGEDASWLQGESFQSIVIVRFTLGTTRFVSEEFVSKPHVH